MTDRALTTDRPSAAIGSLENGRFTSQPWCGRDRDRLSSRSTTRRFGRGNDHWWRGPSSRGARRAGVTRAGGEAPRPARAHLRSGWQSPVPRVVRLRYRTAPSLRPRAVPVFHRVLCLERGRSGMQGEARQQAARQPVGRRSPSWHAAARVRCPRPCNDLVAAASRDKTTPSRALDPDPTPPSLEREPHPIPRGKKQDKNEPQVPVSRSRAHSGRSASSREPRRRGADAQIPSKSDESLRKSTEFERPISCTWNVTFPAQADPRHMTSLKGSPASISSP